MSIKEMTPQALRDFIRQRTEAGYQLIDVRQAHEYEQAHIPGARLLPLPQLFQTMDRLPADKDLVFYCHSGSRSMVAASMAEEEDVTSGGIYNLAGGMLTWNGGVVADAPQVQLFTQSATPAEMMKTAMNLEKGAMRFYIQAADQFSTHAWSKVFARLVGAEIAHAKTVFGFWLQLDQASVRDETFEVLFEALPGDVLEGGLSLEAALSHIAGVEDSACVRLLELALQIEYAAFDLYRTMAYRVTAPECQQAFLSLAQAEKAHMAALVKVLDACS
jgi:sulfur-carrier protein adenylyltransferase/sulfurtransferase